MNTTRRLIRCDEQRDVTSTGRPLAELLLRRSDYISIEFTNVYRAINTSIEPSIRYLYRAINPRGLQGIITIIQRNDSPLTYSIRHEHR